MFLLYIYGDRVKNFNFSLDKVLGYRKQLLHLEKNTLALEIAKENALYELIEKTQRDINDQANHLKERMTGGTTTIVIRQLSGQIESLKHSLKEHKKQLKIQHDVVEKQREVVVKANQDHTLLEKLKDKRYSEYQYETTKEERSRIEELVVTDINNKERHSPLSV